MPLLKDGQNVLILAHGNSLRGIVKHIDGLSSDEIQAVKIPNGIPLVYKFDHDSSSKDKIKPTNLNDDGRDAKKSLNGIFLGSSENVEEAIADMDQRELEITEEMIQNRGRNHNTLGVTVDTINEDSCEILFSDNFGGSVVPASVKGIQSVGAESLEGKKSLLPPRGLIVMCRHGKTINNNLGLFTGWEDAGKAKKKNEY